MESNDCLKRVCQAKPKEQECVKEGQALAPANSKVAYTWCSASSTCKEGGYCETSGAFCSKTVACAAGAGACNLGGTCEKHTANNCRWTTEAEGVDNLAQPYFCGFKTLGASP